jgi:hypothetical protein
MWGRGLAVLGLTSGFRFEPELLLVLTAIAVHWVLPQAQVSSPFLSSLAVSELSSGFRFEPELLLVLTAIAVHWVLLQAQAPLPFLLLSMTVKLAARSILR